MSDITLIEKRIDQIKNLITAKDSVVSQAEAEIKELEKSLHILFKTLSDLKRSRT